MCISLCPAAFVVWVLKLYVGAVAWDRIEVDSTAVKYVQSCLVEESPLLSDLPHVTLSSTVEHFEVLSDTHMHDKH